MSAQHFILIINVILEIYSRGLQQKLNNIFAYGTESKKSKNLFLTRRNTHIVETVTMCLTYIITVNRRLSKGIRFHL